MELRQLRHFVAVVDHKTYTHAAEALSISQPALTRSIQTLEERLSAKLLSRTTRGLDMTAAGARFYTRARLILNEAEAAAADVLIDSATKRPFRIGVAPMFAADILPQAVAAFATDQPNLDIRVSSALFDGLSASLAQGELDIVLTNLPFAKLDDGLVVEPLYDIEVVYLASADHPLADKTNIAFEQLTAFPWAVVDDPHSNDLYDYIFSSRGETRSPIRLRTNSLSFLKSIVGEPPWITLMPRHMVRADAAEGRLVVLNAKAEVLSRKGGLLYRRTAATDPALKAFAACVQHAFSTA